MDTNRLLRDGSPEALRMAYRLFNREGNQEGLKDLLNRLTTWDTRLVGHPGNTLNESSEAWEVWGVYNYMREREHIHPEIKILGPDEWSGIVLGRWHQDQARDWLGAKVALWVQRLERSMQVGSARERMDALRTRKHLADEEEASRLIFDDLTCRQEFLHFVKTRMGR